MASQVPSARQSVAVDSNLLLLLIVGLFRRHLVPQFKRTRSYTVEDFDLLRYLLLEYRELIVSASVLTEVSNLVSHLAPPAREHVRQLARQLLEDGALKEDQLLTREVMRDQSYPRLGLTDAGLATLAARGVDVLTDDLDLYVHVVRQGWSARNFNHYRFSA